MRKIVILLLFVFAATGVLFTVISSSAQVAQVTEVTQKTQTNDCKCVTDALEAAHKLKAGSTRKEALQDFMEEGGISTAKQRSYVFRKCPYIKIALTFDTTNAGDTGDKKAALKENPEDKIVTISKPYLEYGILD